MHPSNAEKKRFGKKEINIGSGMNIGFFGDSLTEGNPGFSYIKILQDHLPEHDLHNYGRAGDTALSLLRRIQRTPIPEKMDISLLWVGVNDIFVKTSRLYPMVKMLRRQPWTKSPAEFSKCYRKLLSHLSGCSSFLLTVPPLLIGEDLDSDWNNRLAVLAEIVLRASSEYPQTEYIDIRKRFISALRESPGSPFLSRRLSSILLNRTVRTNVRQKPESQAFHLTVDGVHLNERGARLAADIFLEAINGIIAAQA